MFEEIPKNRRYAYARVSSKSQEDNSSLEAQKDEFLTEIAKLTGRGRTTIYKVLKEELNYIPYNRLVKNVNQEANK